MWSVDPNYCANIRTEVSWEIIAVDDKNFMTVRSPTKLKFTPALKEWKQCKHTLIVARQNKIQKILLSLKLLSNALITS